MIFKQSGTVGYADFCKNCAKIFALDFLQNCSMIQIWSNFKFPISRTQQITKSLKSHKVAQLKMSARFLEDLPLFFQRYITSKTLVWFSKSYSILKWTQVYFDQGKWTFHLGIFFKHLLLLLWENRTQSFKVWRKTSVSDGVVQKFKIKSYYREEIDPRF